MENFLGNNSYQRFSVEDISELENIESGVQVLRDVSIDHPDTSDEEIRAWYMYILGIEPYSVACLAIFIPLIIEDLAYRAGTSNIGDSTYPRCLDRSVGLPDDAQCFVPFGSYWVSPQSYTFYVSSISVGVQVFSFVTFGSLADYGSNRKLFLMIFSMIHILCSISFLFVTRPELYGLVSFLFIAGNVCFGTSLVFYNAYLPILVDAHPDVRNLKKEIETQLEEAEVGGDLSASPDSLLQKVDNGLLQQVEKNLHATRESLTNKISSNGFMAGYVGGVSLLVTISLIIFSSRSSDPTYMMQIGVAITGFWFFIILFTFVFRQLKVRPGPSQRSGSWLSLLTFGWRKTWLTLRKGFQLKHLFYCLVSWFFYSDGIATIGMVAILYAKSEFNMSTTELLTISILAPLLAIVGNYFFLHFIYRRFKLDSKQMVLILLTLMTLIPVYGVFGLWIPRNIPLGLHYSAELYVLACYFGFLLGALQSFSRALFAELIPPGLESEFFALYEITDRGSSFLGPLLVGAIRDAAGSLQHGFYALLILFAIGVPFLLVIDLNEGRKQAKDFQVDCPEDEPVN
jgi:UMF1 family MFS transporter